MIRTIELGIRQTGLGKKLSNLYPRPFVFRDIPCGSMEGWLQSVKRENPDEQREVALLSGGEAWRVGQRGNAWKLTQTLWWQGQSYARSSLEYHLLVTQAYDACFEQNVGMIEDLLATGDAVFTHTGKHNSADSVLTVSEYISQMYRLRAIAAQAQA